MTDNEQRFWDRVLELAKGKFSQAVFDFFIADAKLIRISDQVATVLMEEKKELYWKSNLTDIVLTAGFEVFNQEILIDYIFEEPIEQDELSEEFQSPVTPLIPSDILYQSPVISDLNPKYRFDNFISGKGSQWALAAALAVAGSPGTVYNPLFIWGGPGLGKTHLLNAIGNSVLEDNPRARIKYITTENFINEFTTAIRLGTMEELKEAFRHLDVLLIDDIQYMAKKTMAGTQEEFFNTFNALHSNNKQIILTSDRAPEQLNDLEERLVSRFSWGLTQDITPPDYETRIAILQDKIQDYPYQFLPETIEYLAGQFDSNVRELEGALKNISLVASVKRVDTITVDIAAEAIRAKKQEPLTISVIPIETIQTEVGKFYNVSVKEIKSTKRNQNIVMARQVAIFLAREMTDNSLPKIGKEFGGRDHSTILHAYNKIKNMLKTDDGLRIEIETLRQKIK
ncbi:chromosomal replication initiator protein DnaA [Streptococcus hillyeri]|uniref:Chromosomal replication initiator protein DnaA n=1 Tax=Streptococcus hillyeri TaxID=2282420 RepID=A0A3L9DR73_9STRE|nr:chromosomal replication initiator protein DnaA [Streptococcus hillyeri]RLY03445.1 chromosomal replication initiator protein DnaA [Streptococcus hillyeri]